MKMFFFIFIYILLSLYCFSLEKDNLLINPGFEQSFTGWEKLWVREKGRGKAGIYKYSTFDQGMVLKVTFTGPGDWSFAQGRLIPVIPGEVYTFRGWVFCDNVRGGVQFSVVTRDKKNNVIDWTHGIKETTGTHGWKRMEGRFIIPRGITGIQFRITGWGRGEAYFDDLVLMKVKNSPGFSVGESKEIIISHKGTNVSYSVKSDLFRISSSSQFREYQIRGLERDVFLTGMKKNENSLVFTIQNTHYEDIIATVSIQGENTIVFSLSCKGVLENDFTFPGEIRGMSFMSWVVPQNEGLLIPVNDPYYRPSRLELYQGHGGLSMPFIGLTGREQGFIIISKTPDDNYVRYLPPADGGDKVSAWSFVWEPVLGKWGYDRTLILKLIDKGGYVGVAKAYREYAEKNGQCVSLRKKREKVPGVDVLVGGANIWWWEKAESWTRYPDCGNVARELKDAGFTKVLWSNAASPGAIAEMNGLNFVTGRYDIYQDVWDPEISISWLNKEGWPDDLVLNQDGEWRKGWVHREGKKEFPGGVICSMKGFERMKRVVTEELKTSPYRARFIDTTTASPLMECYHPEHILSRSGDRIYKSKILGYLSGELGLVTGSETGIDWAVPFVHYFEGMMSIGPYRLKDAGYDLASYQKPDIDFLRFQTGPYYRIPLFELVYHDSVVSFWYWGDSSNRIPELWQVRDLYNLLYGTGPLYIMDRERWNTYKKEFIRSYKIATRVSGNTGYAEMLCHTFLTPDHTVQYTCFSNKTEVWVNFGDTPYTLDNGTVIQPLGYILN